MRSPASANDAHRAKRSFQPSIDSFFLRADPSSDSSRQQYHERESRSPAIPASIQASLLNVGMRVRKSVPEGYKTHKTLSPKQMDIASYMVEDRGKENMHVAVSGEEDASLRPAELVPFCGLHKVGGYAQQQQESTSWLTGAGRHSGLRPTDAHSVFGPSDFDYLGDNEVVPFFSSQESNASTLSTNSMPARRPTGQGKIKVVKRGYTDYTDSEDELDPILPVASTTFGRFSGYSAQPTSVTPSGRLIAQPKSRRRDAEQTKISLANVPGMRSDDDFEDAAFLKPMEVEMGDV